MPTNTVVLYMYVKNKNISLIPHKFSFFFNPKQGSTFYFISFTYYELISIIKFKMQYLFFQNTLFFYINSTYMKNWYFFMSEMESLRLLLNELLYGNKRFYL